jgi:hypothetical protein
LEQLEAKAKPHALFTNRLNAALRVQAFLLDALLTLDITPGPFCLAGNGQKSLRTPVPSSYFFSVQGRRMVAREKGRPKKNEKHPPFCVCVCVCVKNSHERTYPSLHFVLYAVLFYHTKA